MAIKKRGQPKTNKPRKKDQLRGDDYAMMRELQWAGQPDADLIDWRGNKMKDGSEFPHAMLQPRPNLHMKDLWICPDKETAFRVCKSIAALSDNSITHIELSHKWVWVSFGHARLLPGQLDDKRERVTG